jgi:hypothetical protein
MKKVTVNFNISNKVAYTLVTLLVIVVAVGIINAYGTNDPVVFGHSADEIEGSVSLDCSIIRGFEDGTFTLISYVGDNPGAVGGLATFHSNGENLISGPYNENEYYGLSCNTGLIMTGCVHVGAGVGDSDVLFSNNGCYANENDGASNANSVDILCCK